MFRGCGRVRGRSLSALHFSAELASIPFAESFRWRRSSPSSFRFCTSSAFSPLITSSSDLSSSSFLIFLLSSSSSVLSIFLPPSFPFFRRTLLHLLLPPSFRKWTLQCAVQHPSSSSSSSSVSFTLPSASASASFRLLLPRSLSSPPSSPSSFFIFLFYSSFPLPSVFRSSSASFLPSHCLLFPSFRRSLPLPGMMITFFFCFIFLRLPFRLLLHQQSLSSFLLPPFLFRLKRVLWKWERRGEWG